LGKASSDVVFLRAVPVFWHNCFKGLLIPFSVRSWALALFVLLLIPAASCIDIPIICYILNVPPEILSVSPSFGSGRLLVDVLVRDNNTVKDVVSVDFPGLGCGWKGGFYGASGSVPSNLSKGDGVWQFVIPFSGSRVVLNVSVFDENVSEFDFFSRFFVDRGLLVASKPSTSFDGGTEVFVVYNTSDGIRWKYAWTITNVFMEVVRWHIPLSGWSLVPAGTGNTSALFESGDLRMVVNWTDVSHYRCRLDLLADEAILAVYLPERSSVLVLDPEIVIYVPGGSPAPPAPPAPPVSPVSPPASKRKPSGSGGFPFSAAPLGYSGARPSSGSVFILMLIVFFGLVAVVIVWFLASKS